ncbi:hypothetical protein P7K49_040095 [Saguinus oedipus]|uniref:Uncharacterized protein n=1 Tax=Saguinus oedipus TaxID=9490 RepID=A0ABQ9TBC1_SAGOE|nr:hypothetical protein P7K49_040095 [Saguinus oedipus]
MNKGPRDFGAGGNGGGWFGGWGIWGWVGGRVDLPGPRSRASSAAHGRVKEGAQQRVVVNRHVQQLRSDGPLSVIVGLLARQLQDLGRRLAQRDSGAGRSGLPVEHAPPPSQKTKPPLGRGQSGYAPACASTRGPSTATPPRHAGCWVRYLGSACSSTTRCLST